MVTMSAVKWIFLFAPCFMPVSSHDEEYYDEPCEQGLCKTHMLWAPLGSSVLLPCNFTTSNLSWVTWAHIPEVDLVHFSPQGRIKFLDPRHGRVKAFPNQGSEGNYSIGIDELKKYDMGCYRCEQKDYCLQVQLSAERSTLSTEAWLLIGICAGVASLILLTVGRCCCCMKCVVCNSEEHDNENSSASTSIEGAPAEVPPHEQQMAGADNLVYENDDQCPAKSDPTRNYCGPPAVQQDAGRPQPSQSTSGIYPNLNPFNFERVESQRTKQRFHIELISRLRQASLSRHYYVNQGEISNQQATSAQAENRHRAGVGGKKKKAKENYRNPIYNMSTDQLHQQ